MMRKAGASLAGFLVAADHCSGGRVMLLSLSIRDIVLIDHLNLDFSSGLCVLTGETGAGKTILLDSLGLAAGARGDSSLVRQNAGQGVVSASLSLSDGHPANDLLAEHGLAVEDNHLIVRRILNADGRSRAYINDQPVSAGLLRDLGEMLIEIHGQHDDRGLLNPKGHRDLLDACGGHGPQLAQVKRAHTDLKEAVLALEDAVRSLQEAARDEDYIRHNLAELEELAVERGEEERLADQRARMMRGEKLTADLEEIYSRITEDGGIDATLRSVTRRLERLGEGGNDLDPVIAALDRAALEATDGIAALEQVRTALEFDPKRMEETEERLFALRAAARKHHCSVDDLPALKESFAEKLQALDRGNNDIAGLKKQIETGRKALEKDILALRQAREKAAKELDKAVSAELPPLKLEKARFRTRILPLDEIDWTAEGGERVAFEISTNPGAPFGPLIKIASGGELSRFILALKVALSEKDGARILIFDEVDRGIGGAVAAAVGDRLQRLADRGQVLVVTHSPQVAAKGGQHFRINKLESDDMVRTHVSELTRDERREEIARMLSGSTITDEARAAAASLIGEVRAAE